MIPPFSRPCNKVTLLHDEHAAKVKAPAPKPSGKKRARVEVDDSDEEEENLSLGEDCQQSTVSTSTQFIIPSRSVTPSPADAPSTTTDTN
ncbi:hypothetical protein VKT23_008593 [Stygiomarasmius scandens]|uniref:Uncharacterized protein n=1 Tax=Marasmiellus scandens TaxID=2682957 RepID=A0ABR1JJ60_9AGAR